MKTTLSRNVMSFLPGKGKLILRLARNRLELAAIQRSCVVDFKAFSILDTAPEIVAGKIKAFTQLHLSKPFSGSCEVLVILSRSTVLYKELLFDSAEQSNIFLALQNKARSVIPYNLDEMAYGITLNQEKEAFRAVLYAAPEDKIKEVIFKIRQWGIEPAEIITEDQSLLWVLQSRQIMEPTLLIDWEDERVLALFCESGHISFSRIFEGAHFENDREHARLYQEISHELKIQGLAPVHVMASGTVTEEGLKAIEQYFSVSAKELRVEEKNFELPAIFEGARFWGSFERASLLPKQDKLRRKHLIHRRLLEKAGLGVLIFFMFVSISFLMQIRQKEKALGWIQNEIAREKTGYDETRERLKILRDIANNQRDKIQILKIFKNIAEDFPSDVKLKELRFEKDNFIFQGECRVHASLMQILSYFEKEGVLKAPKLGYTRLRKRNNEDYLEFEVSGKWRP